MILILIAATLAATICESSPVVEYDQPYTASCPAYCDVFGRYRSAKVCLHNKEVYCCGYESYLYCCDDPALKVDTTHYRHVGSCPGADFWYHWRMSVSLVSTMLFVMMCTACCYYCCVKGRIRGRVLTANNGNGQLPNISQTVTLPDGTGQQIFQPTQPYAFAPPQYDTLPKEPPKYGAVYPSGTHSNPAFAHSQGHIPSGQQSSDPLPAEPTTAPSTETTTEPEAAVIESTELPPVYSEHTSQVVPGSSSVQ